MAEINVVDDLLSGGAAPAQVPTGPDVVGDLLSGQPKAAPAAPTEERPWHSFVTGEGAEFPEMKEFRPSEAAGGRLTPEFGQMFMSVLAAATDEQLADVAMSVLPEASLKKDKQGNLIITYRGEKGMEDRYINKPGASKRDFAEFISNFLPFIPAGKVATLPAAIGSRMAAGAAAGAGTSVALDVAQEALGSEQGISGVRAGFTALGGAAGEILGPAAVRVWRALKRTPGMIDDLGRLTGKGRRAAESAGLDPDKMGPELERVFAREAEESIEGAAARVSGKEFGIPVTRGQAAGEFKQLAKEEATRHGAYGERAGDIMRQFDVEQQAAMRGARGEIQARLGRGETRIARPAQAGEVVGPGLTARAGAQKALVDAAYDSAREGEASIGAAGFKGLWRRAAVNVADYEIDAQLTPAGTRALRMLKRLESTTRRRAAKAEKPVAVQLRRLERERRKLLHLEGAAANPTDRAVVQRVKEAFDDWLDDAVNTSLFDGDEAALVAIKAARKENTRYRKLFGGPQSKAKVDKIIQQIVTEDKTPEQVMNMVIGRGKLGSPDVSVDVLRRVKTIAGEEAEEWLVLKEAGWLKLAKEIGGDGFSPTKFKNRLNEVMETNQSWMRELYTPDEINLFERFRDEVMRTVTPEAARNPSKTAYTLGRLAREWAGRMGTMLTFSGSPLGGATFFTMKRLPSALGTRAARKAVEPIMSPRLRAPLFVSGGMAGGRVSGE